MQVSEVFTMGGSCGGGYNHGDHGYDHGYRGYSSYGDYNNRHYGGHRKDRHDGYRSSGRRYHRDGGLLGLGIRISL